jgi:hypothetical protein
MKRLRVLTGPFSPPVEVRDSAFLEPETASRSRPLELRPPYCTSDTPYRTRLRLLIGPWSSFRFTLITESITSPHCRHCQPEKQSDELPASSNRMVTIKP